MTAQMSKSSPKQAILSIIKGVLAKNERWNDCQADFEKNRRKNGHFKK